MAAWGLWAAETRAISGGVELAIELTDRGRGRVAREAGVGEERMGELGEAVVATVAVVWVLTG